MLDGPLEPDLLAGNLRDLARVNRWLGGSALSWSALSSLLQHDRQTTLLDVGTGSADVPRYLLDWARANHRRLAVKATDIRPEIVRVAEAQSGETPGLEVALASTDRIDEEDRSWDVVHSSLVLHHLDEAAAVRMLTEMARVARTAVIVNDLERSRTWWLGAWLLTRVATRNRYTKHDAPLSVQRAYRVTELRAMAEAAGLRMTAKHKSFPGYRYALVFGKPGQTGG